MLGPLNKLPAIPLQLQDLLDRSLEKQEKMSKVLNTKEELSPCGASYIDALGAPEVFADESFTKDWKGLENQEPAAPVRPNQAPVEATKPAGPLVKQVKKVQRLRHALPVPFPNRSYTKGQLLPYHHEYFDDGEIRFVPSNSQKSFSRMSKISESQWQEINSALKGLKFVRADKIQQYIQERFGLLVRMERLLSDFPGKVSVFPLRTRVVSEMDSLDYARLRLEYDLQKKLGSFCGPNQDLFYQFSLLEKGVRFFRSVKAAEARFAKKLFPNGKINWKQLQANLSDPEKRSHPCYFTIKSLKDNLPRWLKKIK